MVSCFIILLYYFTTIISNKQQYLHYIIFFKFWINSFKHTSRTDSQLLNNAETLNQNLKSRVTECTSFKMCFVLKTRKQDVQPPLCCLCLRSNYMWYRCQNDAEWGHPRLTVWTDRNVCVQMYLCFSVCVYMREGITSVHRTG